MNRKVSVFTWEDMDKLHRKVAKNIKESKFSPNLIFGILRCGLIPAIHLAYVLGLDDVGSIKVRTTPTDEILVEKNIEPIVEFIMPSLVVKNKKILLVDAVMASGTTINLSLSELKKYEPLEIKIAIIVNWPNSPYSLKFGDKRPKIDFLGTQCKIWPDFPWEH